MKKHAIYHYLVANIYTGHVLPLSTTIRAYVHVHTCIN